MISHGTVQKFRVIQYVCFFFFTDQPVSMSVIVKIAPRVATNWEDIGYCLLEDHEIDIIRSESPNDLRSASKKMLRQWLESATGKQPKTWRTFLQAFLDVHIDPRKVIAVLDKEPVPK